MTSSSTTRRKTVKRLHYKIMYCAMFFSAKVKLEGRHLRGFITIRSNTCVKQFYTITVEQLTLKKI